MTNILICERVKVEMTEKEELEGDGCDQRGREGSCRPRIQESLQPPGTAGGKERGCKVTGTLLTSGVQIFRCPAPMPQANLDLCSVCTVFYSGYFLYMNSCSLWSFVSSFLNTSFKILSTHFKY